MVFVLTKAAIIAAILALLGLKLLEEPQQRAQRLRNEAALYANPRTLTSPSSSCDCQLITNCLSSLRGNEMPRFCGFEGIQRKICCDNKKVNASDSSPSAFLNTAEIQAKAAAFYRNQNLYNNEKLKVPEETEAPPSITSTRATTMKPTTTITTTTISTTTTTEIPETTPVSTTMSTSTTTMATKSSTTTEKPKETRKLDIVEEEQLKNLQKQAGSFLAEYFPDYYTEIVKNLTQLENVTFVDNIPVPKSQSETESETVDDNIKKQLLHDFNLKLEDLLGTTVAPPTGDYDDVDFDNLDIDEFLNIQKFLNGEELKSTTTTEKSILSSTSSDKDGIDRFDLFSASASPLSETTTPTFNDLQSENKVSHETTTHNSNQDKNSENENLESKISSSQTETTTLTSNVEDASNNNLANLASHLTSQVLDETITETISNHDFPGESSTESLVLSSAMSKIAEEIEPTTLSSVKEQDLSVLIDSSNSSESKHKDVQIYNQSEISETTTNTVPNSSELTSVESEAGQTSSSTLTRPEMNVESDSFITTTVKNTDNSESELKESIFPTTTQYSSINAYNHDGESENSSTVNAPEHVIDTTTRISNPEISSIEPEHETIITTTTSSLDILSPTNSPGKLSPGHALHKENEEGLGINKIDDDVTTLSHVGIAEEATTIKSNRISENLSETPQKIPDIPANGNIEETTTLLSKVSTDEIDTTPFPETRAIELPNTTPSSEIKENVTPTSEFTQTDQTTFSPEGVEKFLSEVANILAENKTSIHTETQELESTSLPSSIGVKQSDDLEITTKTSEITRESESETVKPTFGPIESFHEITTVNDLPEITTMPSAKFTANQLLDDMTMPSRESSAKTLVVKTQDDEKHEVIITTLSPEPEEITTTNYNQMTDVKVNEPTMSSIKSEEREYATTTKSVANPENIETTTIGSKSESEFLETTSNSLPQNENLDSTTLPPVEEKESPFTTNTPILYKSTESINANELSDLQTTPSPDIRKESLEITTTLTYMENNPLEIITTPAHDANDGVENTTEAGKSEIEEITTQSHQNPSSSMDETSTLIPVLQTIQDETKTTTMFPTTQEKGTDHSHDLDTDEIEDMMSTTEAAYQSRKSDTKHENNYNSDDLDSQLMKELEKTENETTTNAEIKSISGTEKSVFTTSENYGSTSESSTENNNSESSSHKTDHNENTTPASNINSEAQTTPIPKSQIIDDVSFTTEASTKASNAKIGLQNLNDNIETTTADINLKNSYKLNEGDDDITNPSLEESVATEHSSFQTTSSPISATLSSASYKHEANEDNDVTTQRLIPQDQDQTTFTPLVKYSTTEAESEPTIPTTISSNEHSKLLSIDHGDDIENELFPTISSSTSNPSLSQLLTKDEEKMESSTTTEKVPQSTPTFNERIVNDDEESSFPTTTVISLNHNSSASKGESETNIPTTTEDVSNIEDLISTTESDVKHNDEPEKEEIQKMLMENFENTTEKETEGESHTTEKIQPIITFSSSDNNYGENFQTATTEKALNNLNIGEQTTTISNIEDLTSTTESSIQDEKSMITEKAVDENAAEKSQTTTILPNNQEGESEPEVNVSTTTENVSRDHLPTESMLKEQTTTTSPILNIEDLTSTTENIIKNNDGKAEKVVNDEESTFPTTTMTSFNRNSSGSNNGEDEMNFPTTTAENVFNIQDLISTTESDVKYKDEPIIVTEKSVNEMQKMLENFEHATEKMHVKESGGESPSTTEQIQTTTVPTQINDSNYNDGESETIFPTTEKYSAQKQLNSTLEEQAVTISTNSNIEDLMSTTEGIIKSPEKAVDLIIEKTTEQFENIQTTIKNEEDQSSTPESNYREENSTTEDSIIFTTPITRQEMDATELNNELMDKLNVDPPLKMSTEKYLETTTNTMSIEKDDESEEKMTTSTPNNNDFENMGTSPTTTDRSSLHNKATAFMLNITEIFPETTNNSLTSTTTIAPIVVQLISTTTEKKIEEIENTTIDNFSSKSENLNDFDDDELGGIKPTTFIPVLAGLDLQFVPDYPEQFVGDEDAVEEEEKRAQDTTTLANYEEPVTTTNENEMTTTRISEKTTPQSIVSFVTSVSGRKSSKSFSESSTKTALDVESSTSESVLDKLESTSTVEPRLKFTEKTSTIENVPISATNKDYTLVFDENTTLSPTESGIEVGDITTKPTLGKDSQSESVTKNIRMEESAEYQMQDISTNSPNGIELTLINETEATTPFTKQNSSSIDLDFLLVTESPESENATEHTTTYFPTQKTETYLNNDKNTSEIVSSNFADLFSSNNNNNKTKPNLHSNLILDIIRNREVPAVNSSSEDPKISLQISTGRGNRSLTNPEAIDLANQLGSKISNVVSQLLFTAHKNFHLLPLFTECANAKRSRKKSRVLNLEYEHLPHVVRIGVMEPGGLVYSCAGTLISKSYVLTSANCLENKFPITTVLLEDEFNVKHYVEIQEIKLHSQYSNKTLENDIALIRLKKEEKDIKPVCLPFEDAYGLWESIPEIPGEPATLAGWTKAKVKKDANMDETTVEIIPSSNCTNLAFSNALKTPFTSQICTNTPTSTTYFTRGSPLMVLMTRQKLYFQIGILSHYNDHAQLHTRITAYLLWILDNIEE